MSNCIEFRRAKLTAPREVSEAAAEHLAQCPECAGFDVEVDELDRRLEEAARVPVPENLAERVLLRHQLRRGQPRRNWLALAAAVVLSAAVTLMYVRESAQQDLARRMIAHVLSEPDVWAVRESMPPERVAQAFASIGATLRADFGQVTFLDQCKGLDPGGTHLVVKTPHGQAAVLLLPNAQRWRRAGVVGHGLVASVGSAEKGVVAVVADSASHAERIEDMLRQALRWSS